MKVVSHKLKGSASLMGAHKLVDACAQLETAVEADNWPRIHHLLLGLDGLLRNIKTSAEAYLKAHEASCV